MNFPRFPTPCTVNLSPVGFGEVVNLPRWKNPLPCIKWELSSIIIVACLVTSGVANAASPIGPVKPVDIEINIESTRPRPTVGKGFGITGEVTNLSDSVIYLHEKAITMSMPPELTLDDPTPTAWWARFPTEEHAKRETYYEAIIAIQPGESYKAVWYTGPPAQFQKRSTRFLGIVYRAIVTELRYLFFSPGDYTITISAKYWAHPEEPPLGKYHTKVESKTLTVDCPPVRNPVWCKSWRLNCLLHSPVC